MGNKATKFYFGTDKNGRAKTDGIILDFDEITYSKSYAISQKIDLSCWQDSEQLPVSLKNIFYGILLNKAESLAKEPSLANVIHDYEFLQGWFASHLNSHLPETQKIALLDFYFKYIWVLTSKLNPGLTPHEDSFIATELGVLIQPFLDSSLSIEQKINLLDKGLLALPTQVYNEGVSIWFQVITKSSLSNIEKRHLLRHIINSDLPEHCKSFLQRRFVQPWLSSIS